MTRASHVVLIATSLLLAAGPVWGAGETQADLERQRADVQRAQESAGREADLAIQGVLQGTERDLEAKRQDLQRRIRAWTENLQEPDQADLHAAVREALDVARANGLDIPRLTRIHELTKKVIRTADFAVGAGPPKPQFRDSWVPFVTESVVVAQRVSDTLLWAIGEDRHLLDAQRRHNEYRLNLTKRAMLAYARALTASRDPLAPCQPRDAGTVPIRGQALPTVGCPDPVVEGLRAYLDAVRTIQSADAPALLAEAEQLVAEQQLVSDVLGVVPMVGDALDFYGIASGEDMLSGQAVPLEVRGMMAFFRALPLIGKVAPWALEQAAKRSPVAKIVIESMTYYVDEVAEISRVASRVYGQAAQEAATVLADNAARRWGMTFPQLREVAETLKRLPPWQLPAMTPQQRAAAAQALEERLKIGRQLREAAMDRIAASSLPPDVHRRYLQRAKALTDAVLEPLQGPLSRRIAATNMVEEHARAFAEVTRRRKEVHVFRGVNPDAARLIGLDWGTKPMGVKPKSAAARPIAASIPVDPRLNKLGTEVEELREQLGRAQDDTASLRARLAEAEKDFVKGAADLKACFESVPPCAKKIPFPVGPGEKPLLFAQDAASGKTVFVEEVGPGQFRNVETGQAVVPHASPRPVEILADPVTGRPLTADYDLLAFGERGRHSSPTYNKDTGYITRQQQEIVRDMNQAAQARGFRGGNVVHHGAEAWFPGSRASMADPPLTVFDETGNILHIPRCDDACMRRWCEARGLDPATVRPDPQRLVKDYFHLKRLQQINLDPNPRWDWGFYNALDGWLPLLDLSKVRRAAR
jgi:hypothetical protein